jgi:hypothetical protein
VNDLPYIAPLDPARHRNTRLGPFPDYSHASKQQHVILGLSEIVLAAADYPLVLMKHADTGRFNVVALYGFATGRNLYVDGSQWRATYVPQSSLRYPFLASDSGVLGLALDERSGLIGSPEGHRLFDEAGRPTEYTVQVANTLQWLRQDFAAMQELVQALTQLSLVKPLSLLLRLEDATEQQIEGLYTIGDQALAALADTHVVALHRKGALRAVSILTASLVQLNRLQQLHNAQSPVRIVDIAMMLRE